jgi:hypothetical protein
VDRSQRPARCSTNWSTADLSRGPAPGQPMRKLFELTPAAHRCLNRLKHGCRPHRTRCSNCSPPAIATIPAPAHAPSQVPLGASVARPLEGRSAPRPYWRPTSPSAAHPRGRSSVFRGGPPMIQGAGARRQQPPARSARRGPWGTRVWRGGYLGGISTRLIAWITPLDARTSGVTTRAPPTRTTFLRTRTSRRGPASVRIDRLLTTRAAG